MTTLALPAISRKAPVQASFNLVHNTQTFESPLNKSVQTYELPGARWYASWTYQNLTDADARILKAWLAKLRGQAGRFSCHDWTHPTPAGSALSGANVLGAGQSGRTLAISGMIAPHTTNYRADSTTITSDSTATCDTSDDSALIPGDYFGVNGELKLVTDFLDLDANGNGIIAFEPPLRTAPDDGAIITIIRPTCTMRLTDDKQDNMTFREQKRTDITITAVEVFS